MRVRFSAVVGGVRARLFLASLVVVSLVILMAGVVAHQELRAFVEARIDAELENGLRAARVAAEVALARPDDELADRLGAALGVRVSFMDADGAVRGDSLLDAVALAQVENHGHRPEVARALAGQSGRDRRMSDTLHKDMLYLAAPFARTDGTRGVVRVAADYGVVAAAAARLRFLLAGAGGLGLLAAIVMSAFSSHLLSRTLRELVAHARALGGDRFDEDEIVGVAGTFQRLAGDLGRAVSSLAAERDRFAAVLESMVEGVVGLDAEGRVTFVNRAARSLLGAPAEADDLSERTLLELARVPGLDEIAQRARGGEVSAGEVELHAPVPRTLLVRAAPVSAGGTVLVLHDVTEVRRLERVRRDFVANVSHELRTPVSVIRANAETLLLGGMDDRARAPGFLEAIERNAERLTRLVGDLLDLARIEAGQMTLSVEPVALRPLCERAAEAVEVRCRERQHELTIDVDDALVAVVDEKAADQILVNLLDNAVKYTPAGGHIRMRAHRHEDRVRLDVEDDGPGIAASHRARLFERFYRVDPGRSRDVGGTGLGLSIVKHLVEAMAGRVGVEAVDPHGSRFFLDLPAARTSAAPSDGPAAASGERSPDVPHWGGTSGAAATEGDAAVRAREVTPSSPA